MHFSAAWKVLHGIRVWLSTAGNHNMLPGNAPLGEKSYSEKQTKQKLWKQALPVYVCWCVHMCWAISTFKSPPSLWLPARLTVVHNTIYDSVLGGLLVPDNRSSISFHTYFVEIGFAVLPRLHSNSLGQDHLPDSYFQMWGYRTYLARCFILKVLFSLVLVQVCVRTPWVSPSPSPSLPSPTIVCVV